MDKEKKEKILKREEKYKRIASTIAGLEVGDVILPTPLALKSNIHKDTLCDLLDLYDSLQQIGFVVFRDSEGEIKTIHRVNENLDVKKEIRELRKEFIDIKTAIERIEIKLSKRKK